MKRVHLFTLIQLTCLTVLWLIKSFSYTSILFPLMLVVMIGIRKSLDCIFTRRELKILDDVMPEITKREADDLTDLEGGATVEVGLLKRIRICCIGTKSPVSRSRNRELHLSTLPPIHGPKSKHQTPLINHQNHKNPNLHHHLDSESNTLLS